VSGRAGKLCIIKHIIAGSKSSIPVGVLEQLATAALVFQKQKQKSFSIKNKKEMKWILIYL